MTADPSLTETDLDALARMGIPRTSLDLPKERRPAAIEAGLAPAAHPNEHEEQKEHQRE